MRTLTSSFLEPEECRETASTFTSPSPHNTSVLEENNKITNTTPYDIHSSEQTLPHHMLRVRTAQLRANKSPVLQSYLHMLNPDTYMPQC